MAMLQHEHASIAATVVLSSISGLKSDCGQILVNVTGRVRGLRDTVDLLDALLANASPPLMRNAKVHLTCMWRTKSALSLSAQRAVEGRRAQDYPICASRVDVASGVSVALCCSIGLSEFRYFRTSVTCLSAFRISHPHNILSTCWVFTRHFRLRAWRLRTKGTTLR